jgi:anti-sigma factor RsiW
MSENERTSLEEALERSPELRAEKERIRQQRELLSEGAAGSFGPGFSDRVMGRLDASAASSNGWELFYATLLTLFRRFAIAGAVALLLLLTYNLRLGDKLSSEEIFFASDATYEELKQLPLF